MQVTDKVAIFWDYENCALPTNTPGFLAVNNIRRLAHQYGSVISFKAYLELPEQPSSRSVTLRSELQSCGVSLIDCPHNGRKDVADKMILVDMLTYAIDNSAPATIILISGDRDFVYAVSVLGLRRYRVILLSPVAAHVSLKAQAAEVFDWPGYVVPVPEKAAVSSCPSTPPSVDSNKSHSQDVFNSNPFPQPRSQSTKPPPVLSTPPSPTVSRQDRQTSEPEPVFTLAAWKAKQAEMRPKTPAVNMVRPLANTIQSPTPSTSSTVSCLEFARNLLCTRPLAEL
ncbi:NYN domain-containing protein [Sparassis latifolia]